MNKKIKIILKKDYKNIGKKNNIIYVKKGYALNYLVPNKIAEIATEKIVKHFKIIESIEKQKIENTKIEIEKLQKQINLIDKIIIYKKVGDNQYIFGSVTEKEIIEKITEYTGIELEKKYIHLENIKTTGVFYLDINLAYQKFCKIAIHLLPINI